MAPGVQFRAVVVDFGVPGPVLVPLLEAVDLLELLQQPLFALPHLVGVFPEEQEEEDEEEDEEEGQEEEEESHNIGLQE